MSHHAGISGDAASEALLLAEVASAASAVAPSPMRWLVLLTFSIVSAQQQISWVIPGAVVPNFQAIYGFSLDTIQLLENYGTIFFIVFAVPSMWALDRLGCRAPVLACVALMLACNALRFAARDGSLVSVVCVHLSMVLDAIVGPVVMAAPSKLAEDWFPARERTLATAIAALSNQSGSIVVYALVPLLCPDASELSMFRLNAAMLGLSALNVLLAALYFPSHPPSAPSASAAVSKENEARVTLLSLLAAWRTLARDAPYVCVMLAYALTLGIANPQGALLEPSLANLGASEGLAGWVNAAAQLASLLLGVAVSAGVDALKRRARWLHKAALVGTVAASGLLYLAYAATYALPPALAEYALPLAAATYVGGNGFIGAAIPLLFDSAAEHAFGKGPEAAMLMGLVLPLNIVTLGVLFAPSASFQSWVNYACAAVALVSAAALHAFVPSTLERLDFDLRAEEEKGVGIEAKGQVE